MSLGMTGDSTQGDKCGGVWTCPACSRCQRGGTHGDSASTPQAGLRAQHAQHGARLVSLGEPIPWGCAPAGWQPGACTHRCPSLSPGSSPGLSPGQQSHPSPRITTRTPACWPGPQLSQGGLRGQRGAGLHTHSTWLCHAVCREMGWGCARCGAAVLGAVTLLCAVLVPVRGALLVLGAELAVSDAAQPQGCAGPAVTPAAPGAAVPPRNCSWQVQMGPGPPVLTPDAGAHPGPSLISHRLARTGPEGGQALAGSRGGVVWAHGHPRAQGLVLAAPAGGPLWGCLDWGYWSAATHHLAGPGGRERAADSLGTRWELPPTGQAEPLRQGLAGTWRS